MILADAVRQFIDKELEAKELYLVDLTVGKQNRILVLIDSLKGVTVTDCAFVNRLIESGFNRETEDFEVEVSSPGLDRPITMPFQFIKNVGRQVELLTREGETLKGKIVDADEHGITFEQAQKRSMRKKDEMEALPHASFTYEQINSAKVKIIF